jgi:hypothetical protein
VEGSVGLVELHQTLRKGRLPTHGVFAAEQARKNLWIKGRKKTYANTQELTKFGECEWYIYIYMYIYNHIYVNTYIIIYIMALGFTCKNLWRSVWNSIIKKNPEPKSTEKTKGWTKCWAKHGLVMFKPTKVFESLRCLELGV